MTQSLDESRMWAKHWTQQIGDQVRAWRGRRGLSAQDLSEITARLGYPISRNTITSLENGRKELVPVQEVAVLGRALRIAPLLLIFPFDESSGKDGFLLSSGGEIPAAAAADWFSGESSFIPDGGAEDGAAGPGLDTVTSPSSWNRDPMGDNESGVLGVHRTATELSVQCAHLLWVAGSLQELHSAAENVDVREGYRASIALILTKVEDLALMRAGWLDAAGLPNDHPLADRMNLRSQAIRRSVGMDVES